LFFLDCSQIPELTAVQKKTTEDALTSQIKTCFDKDHRITGGFTKKLVQDAKSNSVSLKCYNNNVTFDAYQDYMDKCLHYRGLPVELESCRPRLRNKETESIEKDPLLLERVMKCLREKYYYFEYCNRCLCSSDDIFPSTR